MRTSVSILPIAWMAALLSTSCSSPTEPAVGVPKDDQVLAPDMVILSAPSEYALLVGESVQFFAHALRWVITQCSPDDSGSQRICGGDRILVRVEADFRWESSDTTVVTVREGPRGPDESYSGVVQAVSPGTATISVAVGEKRSMPVSFTVARETDLDFIYDALELQDLKSNQPSYTTAETVGFTYDLENTSGTYLGVPLNNDFSQPDYLVGVFQQWIERLGPDKDIPGIPSRVFRDAAGRYAAGGEIIVTERALAPGWSRSFPSSFFDISSGWPTGSYRFYVDYEQLGGQVIQTATIDFDIGSP